MSSGRTVLGIDTSNYKTSLALVADGKTICDIRRLLTVKEGERGLRQSEALVQHIVNLPELFRQLRETADIVPDAIACSVRPRPVEGSYMPCFLPGKSQAESMALAMGIPLVEFSHQEGHIEAIRKSGRLEKDEFLACHFSGGTCEILKALKTARGYDIEITGGTKDISYGQVLDRAGVAMGYAFPCGEELDRLALKAEAEGKSASDILTPVKVKDGCVNLSGFESQIQRVIAGRIMNGGDSDDPDREKFVGEIFRRMSASISEMIMQNARRTGIDDVIMSGGVSASVFIRRRIEDRLKREGIRLHFGDSTLSSDNAVGIAYLGERVLWD